MSDRRERAQDALCKNEKIMSAVARSANYLMEEITGQPLAPSCGFSVGITADTTWCNMRWDSCDIISWSAWSGDLVPVGKVIEQLAEKVFDMRDAARHFGLTYDECKKLANAIGQSMALVDLEILADKAA